MGMLSSSRSGKDAKVSSTGWGATAMGMGGEMEDEEPRPEWGAQGGPQEARGWCLQGRGVEDVH